MTPDVQAVLRQLHLDHAAAALPAWLERAAHEDVAYPDFLAGPLEEEVCGRGGRGERSPSAPGGFPVCRHHLAVRLPLSIRVEAPGDLALS